MLNILMTSLYTETSNQNRCYIIMRIDLVNKIMWH